MAISIGAAPTTNTVTASTGGMAQLLDRLAAAKTIGIIQTYYPTVGADSFTIVLQPTYAQIVADKGGTSAFNTAAAAHFTNWNHVVT